MTWFVAFWVNCGLKFLFWLKSGGLIRKVELRVRKWLCVVCNVPKMCVCVCVLFLTTMYDIAFNNTPLCHFFFCRVLSLLPRQPDVLVTKVSTYTHTPGKGLMTSPSRLPPVCVCVCCVSATLCALVFISLMNERLSTRVFWVFMELTDGKCHLWVLYQVWGFCHGWVMMDLHF